MPDPLKIDADGPTQECATVSFKNWGDEFGLVTRKGRLEHDARNLRHAARLLAASADQDHQALSQSMLTMADQFTNAACGYDVNVEPKSYDEEAKKG